MLSKLDFLLAKCKLFDSSWYKFVTPAIDYGFEVWHSYTFKVEAISEKCKKTFPGLYGVLTRDAASVGTKGVVAVLGATCKTHKKSGEQVLRPLHKSTRNPLIPGMKFLRHFMRQYLAGKPHILKNSRQLKEKLDRLIVLAADLLVSMSETSF